MKTANIAFRYFSLFCLLAVIWMANGCRKDPGSYEAEIETICFVRRPDAQSIRVVSDTIRPTSTRSYVMLTHDANLDSIIPVFTVSAGASANVQSGKMQKVDNHFEITVTSENGEVSRTYRFDLSKQDAPPIMPTPGDLGLNGEAEIIEFSLQGIEAEISRRGTRIVAIVNETVDLAQIKPIFTLSEGATADFQSGQTYDFNDPLFIRVESENKAAVTTYRIYVNHDAPPPESDAEIWDFRFEEVSNKPDVNGTHITFYLESSVNVAQLTPRFEISNGATASLRSGVKTSFEEPVEIIVYSQDRSAKSVYTVTVHSVKGDKAELLDFKIKELISPDNPTAAPDLITGSEIYYWVEENVELNKLTPQFSLSKGATANIQDDVAIDLSAPIDFVITSEDGLSSKTYRIIVELANASVAGGGVGKKITSMLFDNVVGDVNIEIYEHRIVAIVPEGTDLTNISISFSLELAVLGAKPELYLRDGDKKLEEGSIIDCSEPVYLYTKKGLITRNYVLEVYTKSHEPQPKVEKFSFKNVEQQVVIGESRIYCTVPSSLDRTKMTPIFKVAEGVTSSLESGKTYDFSEPVQLTLTSPSGNQKKSYIIEVTVGKSSEAELTDFTFDEIEDKPTINGSRIDVYAGEEINVKSLTPRFKISHGATVNIQAGVSRDFSRPVRITIVSEDETVRKVYTVYVEQNLNSEAEILTFSFKEFEADCSISGSRITFSPPPSGVNTASLTPIFTLSHGATSSYKSGVTGDFSKPVTIVVTSQDESMTKSYTVRMDYQSMKYDFESWRGFETGDKYYEHPTGSWSSGNPGIKMVMNSSKRYPMRKTSDSHSGSYAAVLTTEELGGIAKVRIAAGSLFLGQFDASQAMEAPLTCPKFGVPYAGPLPDRFKGWYKYKAGPNNLDGNGNAVNEKDRPDIYAILYSGTTITAETVHNNPSIIAIARVPDLGDRSEYTQFDIPFEYLKEVPKDVVLKFSIIITSSHKGGEYQGAIGSELYVDDFEVTVK